MVWWLRHLLHQCEDLSSDSQIYSHAYGVESHSNFSAGRQTQRILGASWLAGHINKRWIHLRDPEHQICASMCMHTRVYVYPHIWEYIHMPKRKNKSL